MLQNFVSELALNEGEDAQVPEAIVVLTIIEKLAAQMDRNEQGFTQASLCFVVHGGRMRVLQTAYLVENEKKNLAPWNERRQ